MVYKIIFAALLLLFLIAVGITIMQDIKSLVWIKRILKKPYKQYVKANQTLNPSLKFQLPDDSFNFLNYYMSWDKISIENLIFDIKYKLQERSENKFLTDYFTTGCIPLISLVIAGFAMLSNQVPNSQVLSVFGLTMVVFFVIIVFVLLEFTSKIRIQQPMLTHLFVLENALNKKSNETTALDPKKELLSKKQSRHIRKFK